MKKIIFLFLATITLPLCAMDTSRLTPEQNEELAFWRFKYLVESFWPDMYTPNLSVLEKRGTLLLLRLPWERKYTQPYREYENDFWGYLNHMVILSLLGNKTQRKNFIDLRNQIGILMGTLEEDVQKRVGPPSMGVLMAQHHQQTKEVLLNYRPRILELLKDIKDPYKTVETVEELPTRESQSQEYAVATFPSERGHDLQESRVIQRLERDRIMGNLGSSMGGHDFEEWCVIP